MMQACRRLFVAGRTTTRASSPFAGSSTQSRKLHSVLAKSSTPPQGQDAPALVSVPNAPYTALPLDHDKLLPVSRPEVVIGSWRKVDKPLPRSHAPPSLPLLTRSV